MTLAQLQKQIVSGTISNVLVLYGEEVAVMDIYLDKIYKCKGGDVVRCETVQDAFTKLTRPSVTAANSRAYVVRDDREFLRADTQWEKVFTAAKKGENCLILVYSSLDKRLKFCKQYADVLCEFEKLSSSILSKYIEKIMPTLPERDRVLLAEICECDYSRILLEVDKIQRYSDATKCKDFSLCLQQLLQQGVIYQPIGDITFQFTDAILTRNYKDTAKYLMQAKAVGESEILTLSVLYNGFKQILMVQGLGADKSEPVKRTGLTAWQVKMAKEKMGHYTIAELVDALKLIQEVEQGIKTGTIEAGIAVEYVIVHILERRRLV